MSVMEEAKGDTRKHDGESAEEWIWAREFAIKNCGVEFGGGEDGAQEK